MKKKKFFVALLAGFMAFLMLFGLVAAVLPSVVSAESSSVIKEQLDALEQQKKELQDKLSALENQIKENTEDIKDAVANKNTIDQEISLLYAQIRNINEQISAYSIMIADKQEELDAAQQRLDELVQKNKERIRSMEENGKMSYWSVLFQARNFADLLDRINMVRQIADSDRKRLQEMKVAAQTVADAKKQLEGDKLKLEDSRKELNASEQILQAKRLEVSEILANLVARGEEYKQLLDENELSEADLLEQIAQKEKEYDEKVYEEWLATSVPPTTKPTYTPPPNTTNADWIVPCDYEWLSSPFGERWHPTQGIWKMHYGVDLAAYEGKPVFATRSGIVTTATYGWSGGNYVTINHGDGFSSTYLHMTHYIVEKGQYVEQGEVIGFVGSTGDSSGPHLHFGILKNGNYVNPADYVDFY